MEENPQPTRPDAGERPAVGPASSAAGPGCPTCTAEWNHSYVYALGRIEAHFPQLAVEKEFAQVLGRGETAGLTDRQAIHLVLSKHRYLARSMCYVLTIEGLPNYIVVPRDPADFDQLVAAIRPTPQSTDVDVIIGMRGSIASPEMCNNLMLPVVSFDQLYSFDVNSLIKAIPVPENMEAKKFAPIAEELFQRIMQMADNAGSTDAHRAMNYLAVRYSAIYVKTAEQLARDASLTAVEVRPSVLSGTRRIMEVILAYTDRHTDVIEKWFTRVDVTEKFPFLVTKLSPYYDR